MLIKCWSCEKHISISGYPFVVSSLLVFRFKLRLYEEKNVAVFTVCVYACTR